MRPPDPEWPAMGFVVKAVSENDLAKWLSLPRFGGYRVFGRRESAEVFETRSDAHSAVDKMPRSIEDASFVFTIESAE
jgi:hypothetical protein